MSITTLTCWDLYLSSRADVIDWFHEEFECTDKEIAERLSMDETQVFLVRTRKREPCNN